MRYQVGENSHRIGLGQFPSALHLLLFRTSSSPLLVLGYLPLFGGALTLDYGGALREIQFLCP